MYHDLFIYIYIHILLAEVAVNLLAVLLKSFGSSSLTLRPIRPISKTVEIFITGLHAASFSLLASNLGLKSSTGSRWANEGTSFDSSSRPSSFSSLLLFSSIWCKIVSLVENIWKRTASHIFVATGGSLGRFSSGVTGSSKSISVGAFCASLCSGPAISFWDRISGNLGSSCSMTMCFLSRDQPLNLDFTPSGPCMTLRRGLGKRDSSPSFISVADLTNEADSALVSLPLVPVDSIVDILAGRAVLCSESSALALVASTGFASSLLSETSVFVSVPHSWTLSLPKSFLGAIRGSFSSLFDAGCLASEGFNFGLATSRTCVSIFFFSRDFPSAAGN
uniref:Uncharacterized protein n=1 Tax=Gasterosteus aculeatus aculeatus TaxID=481459 RepID=A0AAQ4P499_GASAC|nr:uncharacterized protein LOC120812340 [Gasterosteus aculeatus aculeatus]